MIFCRVNISVEPECLFDAKFLPSGTVGGGYAGMDCQIFLKGSVPIMIGIVFTKSNPIPEGSTLNLSLNYLSTINFSCKDIKMIIEDFFIIRIHLTKMNHLSLTHSVLR